MGNKGEHNPTITQEHQTDEKVTPCCATIAFTDDDLLLGSKLHNRLLLVVGSIREQHLNRILIDGGSAVNIMPKVVLKKLGISIDELSKSNLTIQGFNQGGQRSIGKIRVGLSIGDVKSNTLIHVIDAKTSYNLLLGRPWVHENGVVPSTLHQCMKYMKDGEVVKIDADINPFAETESYFADAKFYLDSGRSYMEKHVEADSIDPEDSKVQWAAINMSKKRTEEVSIKLSPSKGDMETNIDDEQPMFRYIPRERRKKGQPLLEEYTQQVHPPRKELSHTTFHDLKEKMTIQLHKSRLSLWSLPKEIPKLLVTQIEAEVNKLIEAGFIREVKYPLWISIIVPVKNKNGQIRVCVNFRDLNKTCPKDDFPLPIIELMVDATTGHEVRSFLDGSSGYNQIKMSPKDEEYTAFRTPKGIYCYKVMPFGLKNAGASYQRAMQNIFDDMLHKKVECYVDELVVKTKQREHHLEYLRIIFERLRKFDLKMNPLKCAFGVTSGKFLGFIVRHRGIEVDPAKIDTIQKMPKPKNLRDLRSLQGNLAFIRRFISNLAGRWAPTLGKPLILYIASQERSLGALLAQENEARKEQESSDEFPDKDAFFTEELPAWTMFFDGSARRDGARAGVVLISPERQILPFSFVLGETCSNNAAEYQALIVGLEMASDMKIPQLDVYGDSQLIINQL
ncbi:uncharacterized protein [Solanum tuberosum]|uniref:uncharacterized protein n=1 Tax=Solanum tuberosum TaxID=4113 RepID=UPI00073A4A8D|nr:PREDICTED: uncharacterized protein LOC107061660 [Solanum tuberosum]